jgi:hypothetical protein
MGVPGLVNHLLNFILPALAMAVLLPLCVRWMPMGRAAAGCLVRHMLVLALVNTGVLVAGLLLFGRDGKMVTYLAMAVASASTQWLLLKAWRV